MVSLMKYYSWNKFVQTTEALDSGLSGARLEKQIIAKLFKAYDILV